MAGCLDQSVARTQGDAQLRVWLMCETVELELDTSYVCLYSTQDSYWSSLKLYCQYSVQVLMNSVFN